MPNTLKAEISWNWDWKVLCGPEGFQIWSVERHDIGLCFQQLCLQIPILFILAIISAYYFGRHDGYVLRSKMQLLCIKFRILLVLVLASLPLIQIYIDINESTQPIYQISFLLSAVQCISWFTHFLYNMGLRSRLGLSQRGPISVGIVWSLLLVLAIISLRSHYLNYKHTLNPTYSINLSFGFSICYMIIHIFYGISLFPGKTGTTYINSVLNSNREDENTSLLPRNEYERFIEDRDQFYLGTALENDNWLSKLFFSWVTPLMDKGVNEKLHNSDDLFDLPESLNCATVSRKVENVLFETEVDPYIERYNITPNLWRNKSLVKVLHKCFWIQFYGIGVLKLAADLMLFAGPILLNKLVSFVENKSIDIKWGYVYAACLMTSSIASSLCDSHFNFLMATLGIKIRGALITTIFRKTLTVSTSVLNEHFSVGEILNLMSTDTDRIVNACPSFHAVWSIPFQIAVTLYLLYQQVGLAFIAGLIFSILLIPINKLIANKIGELSTRLMHHKDSRIKHLTEILRGIRAIKLCVWEQHFIRQINKLRDKELKCLKGRKYLDALCVFFWATTPVIISVLTFTTYVLMGHTLNAAKVFTGISLLNMLISPLNAFPWVLNGLTEAWVSIKRIQRLLSLPAVDYDSIYDVNLLDNNTDLFIGNGCFKWSKSNKKNDHVHTSTDSDLQESNKFRNKSSKMLPIAANGDDYTFKLYNVNVKIKKGEFVGIIGPVGSGKSSLLSAILGELYTIDGCMAISQTESGFGFVSQQPWLQRGTIRDNILFYKAYDERFYAEVLSACGLQQDLATMPNRDLTLVGESGTTLSGGQKVRVSLARAIYQDKNVYLLDDILSALDTKVAKHIYRHCIMGLLKNKTTILCTHHLKYLASADTVLLVENGTIKQQGKPVEVLSNIDDELMLDIELEDSIPSTSSSNLDSLLNSIKDEKKTDEMVQEEVSERGSLDSSVYGSYWKAIGHMLSLSIFTSILLMQSSRNMTDFWLSHWVTASETNAPNSTNLTYGFPIIYKDDYNTNYYLRIYIEFAILNCIATLFRAFLFAYGGVMAATKIHKILLRSVIKGKSTFFDITPTGRILNRFSNDIYTIDDSLPFILNIFLAQLFSLLGCIAVTVYGLPWIVMVLVPLVPIYYYVQNQYRLTSRELKRICSVTMSPVFNHFNETLQGLTTIRALRTTTRFRFDSEDNINSYLKADFASQAATRWLGLRLQFIGVAIISGISFLAIIQHQFDIADPGLIGLAISYSLSITNNLSGVVNAFTETEKEMVAVERVNQYIKGIQMEKTHFTLDPPFGWPSQGVIKFNDVVLKYQEHLPPSLNYVSFESRPSEKIGIVGRTGAGKSSLISALFRLVELHSGSIEIDCIDIKCLSLSSLRSRMFCIPQEPFLFSGTIRENLDPLSEFRDTEIWNALSKCNLTNTVKRLSGLECKIEENGQNFSVGQKQLFCLARAILHSAKILIIDEATANVDYETDRQIQQTLRCAFRKCTVITIAHRLQTIQDCDRVLVMNDGRVVEFDHPENLMSDSSSIFYQLINQ